MSRRSRSRRQSSRFKREDSRRYISSSSAYDHDFEDGYRFTLVDGQVTRLQEYDDGRWKNERIDRNEAWTFDGTTLTKTETKKKYVEISTYLDADGDGVFTKSGTDRVTGLSAGSTGSRHFSSSSPDDDHSFEDGYRFTLVDGQVTRLQEYDDGRWKNERMDRNEAWAFDGTTLTKTETKKKYVQISTYLDADGDGVFTESGTDRVTGLSAGSTGSHHFSSSSPDDDHSFEDGYRFTLVDGQVTRLQEYDDGRWKNERIGRNETWTFDGTNLIQEERKRYGTEVSTFSDLDGDGIFFKTSEVFDPSSFAFGASVV